MTRLTLLIALAAALAVALLSLNRGTAPEGVEPQEAPPPAPAAAPTGGPPVAGPDPVAPAPVAAPAPDPTADEVNRLNEEARLKLEAGQPADAVLLLESALGLAPEDEVLRRNLAFAHYKVGDALLDALDQEAAAAAFGRAWDLDRAEPAYGLHLASLRLRAYDLDPALTVLDEVLALHPRSGDAQLMRADVLVLLDRQQEALAAYDQALEHGDERVVAAAGLNRGRAERQLAVERDYVSEETAYFVVRHPQGSSHLTLLGVLERARVEVCHALGSFPDRKALVVLYPPESFREVTGTHEWVGGLFDRKIRLPIAEGEAGRQQVETSFRHEFAHLMVSQWNPRCPTFVNEGLAQVLELGRGQGMGRLVEWLDAQGRSREDLPRLAEMPSSFLAMDDRSAVRLGYLASYAFVDHVAEQHGLGAVVSWIRRMERAPMDEAYREATGRRLEQEEGLFRELVRTARGPG